MTINTQIPGIHQRFPSCPAWCAGHDPSEQPSNPEEHWTGIDLGAPAPGIPAHTGAYMHSADFDSGVDFLTVSASQKDPASTVEVRIEGQGAEGCLRFSVGAATDLRDDLSMVLAMVATA